MSTTKLTVVERRDSYHHGDLAAALKAVAIELIAARGVEGFSLREAAAAVNVSPSAAYKHYASKTELLAAVTEDSFEELNASLQRAMQGAEDDLIAQARTVREGLEDVAAGLLGTVEVATQ